MTDEDRKKTIREAIEVVNGFYEKYDLDPREQNAVRVLAIAGGYLLASIEIMREGVLSKIFN